MSKTQRRIRFLTLISQLMMYATAEGIKIMCFTFHRTPEEQYTKYLQNTSNCDGYRIKSQHQNWLAMDFVVLDEEENLVWARNTAYEKLGRFWKALGEDAEWGGDWASLNDIYHFQLRT